jgi:hypothetical protein
MLNFLGIGAQKCGTTWLFEMLRQHPGVAFPAGKEVHFWDARRDLGLKWYRGLFEGDEVAKGEITPAYGFLPIDVLKEIKSAFPELRLIYLIRNPIDRAWSSAKMALAKAEMTIEEASDQWFIDHFRSRGSLARGDYESCIRNWRSVFPPERVLVLRYDLIATEPARIYAACCEHIGVSADIDALSPRLQSRVLAGNPHPLRENLKAALETLYSGKIRALENYLGEDLSDWLESGTQ